MSVFNLPLETDMPEVLEDIDKSGCGRHCPFDSEASCARPPRRTCAQIDCPVWLGIFEVATHGQTRGTKYQIKAERRNL